MTEPVYNADVLLEEEGGVSEARPEDILGALRSGIEDDLTEAQGKIEDLLRRRAALENGHVRVAAILLTKIQEARLWTTALC